MAPEHAHRSGRRRRWPAEVLPLAASVALHLVLLAWLARAAGPLPAPRPARIAVQLVEVRAAPPRAADPSPSRFSTPSPRQRQGERGRPATERAPQTGRPAASPSLGDEGLAAAPGARAAPDLRPRLSIVAPPPPHAAPGAAAGPGDAADVLRRWAADLAARARVDGGLAHPYHSELASALAKSWDVEDTIASRGVSGYLAHAGQNLATFGRIWQRSAETFGKTGEPGLVDGGSPRIRELSGLPPGPARDALVQAEIARQLRRAWSEGRVASVRVVQDREGRLESVELVAPSRDPDLDREALAAVPAAVAKVRVPPDVLAGRDRLATVWEFEIEVSISPPIPLVTVEFDEALGHLDLRMPLDRRVWKRVRLVGIE